MNRRGLFAFAVALAALATFEYGIAYSTLAGMCGPAGPYAAASCPKPSAMWITLIPLSFPVALVGGLITATTLSARWVFVLWAGLFVPAALGCVWLARAMPHVNAILYGVALMCLVIGIGPAFNRPKAAAKL